MSEQTKQINVKGIPIGIWTKMHNKSKELQVTVRDVIVRSLRIMCFDKPVWIDREPKPEEGTCKLGGRVTPEVYRKIEILAHRAGFECAEEYVSTIATHYIHFVEVLFDEKLDDVHSNAYGHNSQRDKNGLPDNFTEGGPLISLPRDSYLKY